MSNIPTKELSNGFSLPVYGLGTWQMGGRETRNPSNDDQADIAAIQNAIEHGFTHIDCAESYADGHAEFLIGQAIKDFDRSKLILTSKAHLDNLGHDNLIRSCQNSLKRMGVSYFDLYYAHRFSLTVPLEETMRAFDTLIEEGLIKHIAVSNFNVEELKSAQALTKNKIVANQLHLNLKYREAERKGLLKYCQNNDIMFVAWRPFQKGLLLEKQPQIIEELVEKYQKTPAQITLNWLISQPNVVTLSKTRDVAHLEENLGALDWRLDPIDVDRLTNEYPGQEDISDVVPLH